MGKKDALNLLDLKPKRTMKWKHGSKVAIVVPKARSIIGRHFIDAFGLRPTFKVNLDDFGSAVWRLSDGTRTVREIGRELKRKFGKKVEPVYDRLGLFIKTLKEHGFVKFV